MLPYLWCILYDLGGLEQMLTEDKISGILVGSPKSYTFYQSFPYLTDAISTLDNECLKEGCLDSSFHRGSGGRHPCSLAWTVVESYSSMQGVGWLGKPEKSPLFPTLKISNQ